MEHSQNDNTTANQEEQERNILQPSDAQLEMEKNQMNNKTKGEGVITETVLNETILNDSNVADNQYNNRFTMLESDKFKEKIGEDNTHCEGDSQIDNKKTDPKKSKPIDDDTNNALMKTIFDFKVILVGDINVGKTSILNSFVGDANIEKKTQSPLETIDELVPKNKKAKAKEQPTVGVDYKKKLLNIDSSTCAKLSIWDTAGEERNQVLNKAYYKDAYGALLVYDLTDRNTFEKLDVWIKEIKDKAPSDIIIMIIGNKYDESKMRNVKPMEGTEFAKKKWCNYIEVSAKYGNNISLAFEQWTNEIILKQMDEETNPNKVIRRKERKTLGLEDLKRDWGDRKNCCA